VGGYWQFEGSRGREVERTNKQVEVGYGGVWAGIVYFTWQIINC